MEEVYPGLTGFVVATTQGEIIQCVGDNAQEYGESLGYLHQLAEKVGEVLAFDQFRSLYAKNNEIQYYSEDCGEKHIAAVFESGVSLSQIKQFAEENLK